MEQVILAPEAEATGGIWNPDGPIPPSLRRFGKFPNTETWRPGDLLLLSACKPSWIQRSIAQAQERAGYAAEHARWQHAAVYMGENYILEATRSGVHYSPLYEVLPQTLLRLRRDPYVSDYEGYRVAIQAGIRLRRRYAFHAIFSLLRFSFSTPGAIQRTRITLPHSSLICSTLYGDAYEAVTLRLLTTSRPVTPAALSSATLLSDVALCWREIA